MRFSFSPESKRDTLPTQITTNRMQGLEAGKKLLKRTFQSRRNGFSTVPHNSLTMKHVFEKRGFRICVNGLDLEMRCWPHVQLELFAGNVLLKPLTFQSHLIWALTLRCMYSATDLQRGLQLAGRKLRSSIHNSLLRLFLHDAPKLQKAVDKV